MQRTTPVVIDLEGQSNILRLMRQLRRRLDVDSMRARLLISTSLTLGDRPLQFSTAPVTVTENDISRSRPAILRSRGEAMRAVSRLCTLSRAGG